MADKQTIDCRGYNNSNFLSLIKFNSKVKEIMKNTDEFEDVKIVIDKQGILYTEEQIKYVKENLW